MAVSTKPTSTDAATSPGIPLVVRLLIGLAVFGGLLAAMIIGTEFFQNDARQEKTTDEFANLSPRQQADTWFDLQRWDRAGKIYQNILQEDPFNALALFRAGYCLHQAKEYDEAIETYNRATDFSEVRLIAHYNLACIYAVTDRPDQALDHLRQSIEAGFLTRNGITADPDFASLLDDPEFMRLDYIEYQRRND